MNLEILPKAICYGLDLLVVVFAFWALGYPFGNMRKYWQRPCNGRAWKTRFPSATNAEIRQFLEIFVDSFAFRSKHRLKFHPDDSIYAIYRTIYPSLGGADILELETLALAMQKKYHLDLQQIWNLDLTLGELFSAAHASAA